MITQQIYRIKCRVLANQIAKKKLQPYQIPQYISRQKWFMKLQGTRVRNGKVKFKKTGAMAMFGADWCDSCMASELIRTGVYESNMITHNPSDINSFYGVKIRQL